MALANLFSTNLTSIARSASKDSKIYEAFKPYLSDILGIDLETFMKNKELRRTYQQKYAAIKAKFQEEIGTKATIRDEECLTKITTYGNAWKEFITTAKEYTLDEGKSFIRSTPLDKYILMSRGEKEALEQRLVNAAVERVRVISEQQTALNQMLGDQNNASIVQETQKIQ